LTSAAVIPLAPRLLAWADAKLASAFWITVGALPKPMAEP
jgi:hypothetical protein